MEKRWLVTGSASGLGRSIAEAVVSSGDALSQQPAIQSALLIFRTNMAIECALYHLMSPMRRRARRLWRRR